MKTKGDDTAREIRNIFDDWTHATKEVTKLNQEERNEMFGTYLDAWADLPEPVRAAAISATCKLWGAATRSGAAGERTCVRWVIGLEELRKAQTPTSTPDDSSDDDSSDDDSSSDDSSSDDSSSDDSSSDDSSSDDSSSDDSSSDDDSSDDDSSDDDSSDDDSSSDSDSSGGDSAPEQTPKEAWDQAMRDYILGKLDRAGLQAAANRYQCSQGTQSKCE